MILMVKLLLSTEIYSEKNIKETCDVYKDFAKIKVKRKGSHIELIFNSCKYDPNVTVKEFENYLINTENMKK